VNWVIAKMDHLGKCAVGQKLNSHKQMIREHTQGKLVFFCLANWVKKKNLLCKFISQKQLLDCKTHKNHKNGLLLHVFLVKIEFLFVCMNNYVILFEL